MLLAVSLLTLIFLLIRGGNRIKFSDLEDKKDKKKNKNKSKDKKGGKDLEKGSSSKKKLITE
jgi:hypothetical protein